MSLALLGAGPESGTAGFNPLTLSPAAWFKADAISGKNDGDAVSSWTDSSGNSRPAVQATGANQPLYKTAIQNALPVVRFDGVNDFLGVAYTQAQPVTLFIVGNYRVAWGSGQQAMADGGVSAVTQYVYRVSDTELNIYAGSGVALSVTNRTMHTYTAIFNGASSQFAADGGTPAAGDAGSAAAGGLTLGANATGGAAAPVDICEVIAYSAVLSAPNRALVESYLKTKWATP